MNQARMITSFGENSLDPVFFAKGLMTANELDFNACLDGQLLGMMTQLITQGLCPARVVE